MKLFIIICFVLFHHSYAMTCNSAGEASCDYKIVGSSCQDNNIIKGVCVGAVIYSPESAECVCRQIASSVPSIVTCSSMSGSCKHLSVGSACDLGGTKAGQCTSKGLAIDGTADCSCKKIIETPIARPSRPIIPTTRPSESDPRITNPTPARPTRPGRNCQYPQVC